MQQAVHSAEVHEGAVVGEAADRAANYFAFAYLRVAAFFHAALLFFGDGPPVNHYILFGGIELDNAAADFLPNQLLHLGCVTYAASRGWHKSAHSNVHAETALDYAGDGSDYRRFVGEGLLQGRPIRGLRDLLAGEFVVAVQIAALDRNRHLVARLHNFALERGQPNDAFSLETNVKEDRLSRNGYHRAFELLSTVFFLAGMGFLVLRENVFE